MSEIRVTDLLYLFDRVNEPVYFPKGKKGHTEIFEIATNYLPPKYIEKGIILLNRFASETEARRVEVGELDDALLRIPLDIALSVKRNHPFSIFNKMHRNAADYLIRIFIGLRTYQDLLRFAVYIHDRINSELFVYALATAILHRDDTKNLRIPQPYEIFPQLFISSDEVEEAKEDAIIYEGDDDPVRIEVSRISVDGSGNVEHRLAYFREDVGVNSHHWHWHLIYPLTGPEVVVKKDRRGELFYHSHHQLVARYNVERLCNNLNVVKRLINWDEPIEEGYYANLTESVAGKEYPGRPPNMIMSDVQRPDVQIYLTIDDMKRWRDRIFDAIHKKKIVSDDGTEIDLDNDDGIDVLGNLVEASMLTVNMNYYGDLHNGGHLALAYIHDPEYEFEQDAGVMGYTATAMRDPVFYRWHGYIDDIFDEHKRTLKPYDPQFLSFPEIKIRSVELNENSTGLKNVLNTHFEKDDVDLTRGLDFTPRETVLATFTHLNHKKFAYNIVTENTSGRTLYGTVRIFMGPTRRFENNEITLEEQRILMIEMDRFVTILKPGINTIKRESTESSVIIPFNQIFRDLNTNIPEDEYSEFDAFNFCGCGWPEYMLVPKGNAEGYPMVLFVMISDYTQDKIENTGQVQPGCRTGVTFCGLRESKYPDKKPMGYPFDRTIDKQTLDEFILPNMSTTKVTIYHSNVVKEN